MENDIVCFLECFLRYNGTYKKTETMPFITVRYNLL